VAEDRDVEPDSERGGVGMDHAIAGSLSTESKSDCAWGESLGEEEYIEE